MMADIGNGTMNIIRFQNGKPDERFSWTEKLGVNQCILSMKKRMMDAYGLELPDETIEQFLRTKKANLPRECLSDLDNIATRYVAGLFDSLRSHGYDPRLMKLFVVGGGGCLVKNFGVYDSASVIFEDDLCASAKGFEYMAEVLLWKRATEAVSIGVS
jgi:plasmid segregation protein ParM